MNPIIDELNRKITARADAVERWIWEHRSKIALPLYTSVDLRASRYKIAPVDTNIFPAGFNNLSPASRERAASLFQASLIRKHPNSRSILIVPELHTRNPHYWENVSAIKSILQAGGFRAELGLVGDDIAAEEAVFATASGGEIRASKVRRIGYKIFTEGFVPDIVLINNDFSVNCPAILRDISQPVEPPVEIGWHTRRKNVHFNFYNALAAEIAQILGIDPWTIAIDTELQQNVDFDSQDRELLAASVDSMIQRLALEHLERGIPDAPFVFVKSNRGTYGMAVMNAQNGHEVRSLNADGRKRMRVSKGGRPVRDVVIQEGIPTSLRFDGGTTAEPVLYLIEASVAGGFLRMNRGRTEFENLNTRGMEFAPIPLGARAGLPPAYELVARVASLAAGYEIEKALREGGCAKDAAQARVG
ncbi:MAG: glutamate--cysteine ligase [Deltaproteobacteria bacterium]